MSGAIERAWRDGGALAHVLRPVGALNGALVALRRSLYRRGLLRVEPSALPVIVVGNLSVGGTGKTPLTGHLVAEFRARGWSPGIVSRGHGGERHARPRPVRADDDAAVVGDEPLMLHRQTGAPVCVCLRRAAAVAALAREGDCDIVFSDDGLQHLAMARHAEIVVVDGDAGFGNGRLLPAGPLRELPARADSADLIALRVADLHTVSPALGELPGAGRSGVGAATSDRTPPVFRFATIRPRLRHLPDGDWQALDTFAGRRVHAVAGIGRPQRFFDTLRAHALVVDPRPLADHHVPTAADLTFDDADPVLVTAKDAVKLGRVRDRPTALYEVAVDVETDASAAGLLDALSARLRASAPSRAGTGRTSGTDG